MHIWIKTLIRIYIKTHVCLMIYISKCIYPYNIYTYTYILHTKLHMYMSIYVHTYMPLYGSKYMCMYMQIYTV